ncbi:MAG TPA: hypothetical protein ACHBX0_10620 [Arsenophonus sp.]
MENELIIDAQTVSVPENLEQQQDITDQTQPESEKKATQEQAVDVNDNAEVHSEQETE